MENMFSYPDMIKIERAEFYRLSPIPLPRPFKDGTGGIRTASLFGSWVRLYDTDGAYGEGPCTELMLSFFIPILLEAEPMTNGELIEKLYWNIRNFGYQSAHARELGSLDMILLDLLAMRRKQPLHRFLGAKKDWANVYKGGGSVLLSDEELVEDMLRFKEEGYHQTKFKIGQTKDWKEDLRRLQKVREALGEDFGIAVDANQAWDVDTAFDFAKEAAKLHASWFEEPIHAYDMDGLKELTDRLAEADIDVPIAMGESVRSYHTFVQYAEHGAKHLQPANANLYSISEIMRVRDLAKKRGLGLETGGITFANVVLGTLYDENGLIEYHQPIMEVLVPYMSVTSEIYDGKFYLPSTPGMPMQLDFEKLKKDGLLKEVIYRYAKQ